MLPTREDVEVMMANRRRAIESYREDREMEARATRKHTAEEYTEYKMKEFAELIEKKITDGGDPNFSLPTTIKMGYRDAIPAIKHKMKENGYELILTKELTPVAPLTSPGMAEIDVWGCVDVVQLTFSRPRTVRD